MACNHKFKEDLKLDYVSWEARTLFIGTFNPGWNSIENYAEWFYGRVARNDYWCILPSIHGKNNLLNAGKREWMEFCKDNHIAITDIISSVQGADESNTDHQLAISKFRDSDLKDFQLVPTNIPELLKRHPTIRQICVTRNTMPDYLISLFQPTLDFIKENPDRKIEFRLLRSPSRGARKGVKGEFSGYVAKKWKEQGRYEVL